MIQVEELSKTYSTRSGNINALNKISFTINEGDFLVITGPSGCGKTTLLLSLGGMLHPTEGQLIVANKNIYSMNKDERARFRAENIGFVFQMFHLVPYLNIIENILLAANNSSIPLGRKDARELLKRFNLSDREFHKPCELSTGEKQRTAIARALINGPKIILADEPTGNLDPKNAKEIIGYLAEFHQNGVTVIVVTHGKMANLYADRIIYLNKGQIEKLNVK